MPQVGDIVRRAYKKLGVIGTGRQPTAEEMADGLDNFNALIASLSLNQLFIFWRPRHVLDLVASQQVYTIGEGANWDMPRPNKITAANIIYQANSAQPTRVGLNVIPVKSFADIPVLNVPSTIPTTLYYDMSYESDAQPWGRIWLWPWPQDSQSKLELFTWDRYRKVSDQFDELDLPDGYERFLTLALAAEIAPEFGIGVTPDLAEQLRESRALVYSHNIPSALQQCDTGIRARTKEGYFNYLTGLPN